jgi:hypothetical protein
LEAIAAERMPHRMVVRGVEWSAYFELREYAHLEPRMVAIWNRYEIRPALRESGRVLIPFETLDARERAWREVSSDSEWTERGETVALKTLTLFSCVSLLGSAWRCPTTASR